ncbi:MAG: hypothetical protein P4M12_08695 [Gammaproteobacteria bacterium]|nr:hypothetical protein [Gammaproteobacteria bacterium]
MKHFHFILSVFFISLFSLFCINAQALDKETTTTTTSISPEGNTVIKEVKKTTRVVTPVPTAKEVIAAPQGSISCFRVEEGWFNDIWVPTHQVCQYENTSEGEIWVEGYWGCNKATPAGVCTNWEWKAGHWEKKLVVY